jgi:hypothetical protein
MSYDRKQDDGVPGYQFRGDSRSINNIRDGDT